MNKDKKETANELEPFVKDARLLAEKIGLDPYRVKYWVVDYKEMAEYVAYNGFPYRYPHWRWAMQYDKTRKSSQYLNSRIFEIVINDSPSHAYLQNTNDIADQKGVICHVEGHSDFFKNNEMFRKFTENYPAVSRLSKNAEKIEEIMNRNDISREEIEKFIDTVNCISDNIDQYSSVNKEEKDIKEPKSREELIESLTEKGISEEIVEQTFDVDEMLEEIEEENKKSITPEDDLLTFFMKDGKYYDEDDNKAKPLKDWQKEIINIIREESYYFAPQKLTKVMNEGWATFNESLMMSRETMASPDEILSYADHVSKVTQEDMNPYSLGLNLWRYIEDKKNREQIVRKILKTKNINPNNFFDKVDFEKVINLVEPNKNLFKIPEKLEVLDEKYIDKKNVEKHSKEELRKRPWKSLTYEGIAERNFSLTEIASSKDFLSKIKKQELRSIYKRIDNKKEYDSIENSLENIDYTYSWQEMRHIMKTYTDVTFIDTFLTQEFIEEKELFTYEYDHKKDKFYVESKELKDVKDKLLRDMTNFGKPKIKVEDNNYRNKNYLLLKHEYDGVELNIPKAKEVMKRIYDYLWGRTVYLETVIKKSKNNEIKEVDCRLKYDGKEFKKVEY